MIADRKGWRGSRRASFSSLLRARYRRAASALRTWRGTGLAGRPRLRLVSSPTWLPAAFTDPFARLLIAMLYAVSMAYYR